MASLASAWQSGRAERVTRPARKPVLAQLVGYAARRLPAWRRVRTAALQVAGFGCIDYAVWGWNHLIGYAAIGVSLLVLEALGGEKR
jgi:hypothetical protein